MKVQKVALLLLRKIKQTSMHLNNKNIRAMLTACKVLNINIFNDVIFAAIFCACKNQIYKCHKWSCFFVRFVSKSFWPNNSLGDAVFHAQTCMKKIKTLV